MSSIVNEEILIKVGARGDIHSSRNEDWDESGYGSVEQIFISHGAAINSLQMLYNLDGTPALAHRHGGDGDYFDGIKLESWEHIVAISGRHGPIDNKATGGAASTVAGGGVIRSLTIVTNRTTYGPFGREEGTQFCFNLQLSDFGGFHGRSNSSYLCAIGVYARCIGVKHHFQPDPPARRKIIGPPRLCSAASEEPQKLPEPTCMPPYHWQ